MLIAVGCPWAGEFSRSQSHSQPSPNSTQKSENGVSYKQKAPRQVSNPFDILYDIQKAPSKSTAISSDKPLKSASYIRIEEEIRSGTPQKATGVSRYSVDPTQLGSPPPVVTVVGDGMVRRGGLVISRLASLRNRNSIRLRNKMVHRHDIDNDSTSVFSMVSKRKRKRNVLSFVFPIKRKTSLKYRPVSPALNKFDTQQDANEYFLTHNIASLMRDILPREMLTYNFKGLLKMKPTLHSQPEQFAISRAADFTMLNNLDHRIVTSSLREEQMAQKSVPFDKISSKTSSEQERRQIFISTVTKEYRNRVFAGRYTVPPRVHHILPFEAGLLSPEENVAVDTMLALEVLLRRTLAAKIGYRLNSGLARKRLGAMRREGPQSSSSSDHSGPDSQHHQKHHESNGDQRRKSSENSRRSSSVHTKKLLKEIVPSEAFPSPQISFASQLSFSSRFFDYNASRTRGNLESIDEKYRLQEASVELPQSRETRVHQTPITYITTSSLYSDDNGVEDSSRPKEATTWPLKEQAAMSPTLSNIFVNDFNKVFFENERRRQKDNSLSNLNMYSLRPVNRSVATLSSSGDMGVSEKLTSAPSESSQFGKRTDPELLSYASSYRKGKRASGSTTRTSIIHSLDNLASSVNEYLMSHEGLQHVSTLEATPDVSSPGKQTTSSIYTDSINNSTRDIYGAAISAHSKSQQNLGIQTSPKLPSFARHYTLEKIALNLQKERGNDNDIVGNTCISSGKNVSSRSSNKNQHLMGGSPGNQKSLATNSPSSAYSSDGQLRTSRELTNIKSETAS